MDDWQQGEGKKSTAWRTSEIVYTSLVGTVMVAALLEWFLWLGIFVYCLYQCYRKAERKSTKVLAIILMIVFTTTRTIFLPIMVVTLPLPKVVTTKFPSTLVSVLQWFAFWSFSALLTIPWLFCLYNLITSDVGRERRIKGGLDETLAPKVVVVMPCYNEEPAVLLKAIDSIVEGDYPPACLHLFVSFDGDLEKELYLSTLRSLGISCLGKGNPLSIDVSYRGSRITVSRFKHGGKRRVQKRTFRLIDRIYQEYLKHNDDLFILFIDSDCILDAVCIQNFIWEMELRPGAKKRNMLAMTGVITSTTRKHSLITLLQDMEYLHGQLFERSVESACGAVTCLPGALTILRFSAFRQMAKYYFAEAGDGHLDIFDYGKTHLGEDRYLTHLFMVGATKTYQIGMSTGAFCKTEAVSRYRDLIKQRRRWFIGFITNEACMLTDARLWRKYPILCIMRFMQNTIRTTALLFLIMLLSLMTTSQKIDQLPLGFIAISLGLNWALMVYYGYRLKRFKAWLYPLMFILNPFFNWVYMFHGVITFRERTWGGPRADAEKQLTNTAEVKTLLQPEGDTDTHAPPLQPSEHVEGAFAPPHRDEHGYWNISNLSLPNLSRPTTPNPWNRYQQSFGSIDTISTDGMSYSAPHSPMNIMETAAVYPYSNSGRSTPTSPLSPGQYIPLRDLFARPGTASRPSSPLAVSFFSDDPADIGFPFPRVGTPRGWNETDNLDTSPQHGSIHGYETDADITNECDITQSKSLPLSEAPKRSKSRFPRYKKET